jgi:membrane protease YdiL (CAAX protease family)
MIGNSSGKSERGILLAVIWLITLLVSAMPDFLFQSISGTIPWWLFWTKEAILLVTIGVCFFIPAVKPLWKYLVVLSLLIGFFRLVSQAYTLPIWQQRFGQMAWLVDTGTIRVFMVVIAFLMMGSLILMGFKRKDFFFASGKLDAPAGRIRWLGLKEETPWTKFAPIFTAIAFLVLLIFLAFNTRVPLKLAAASLLWLPMLIFLAGINAFGEELGIRAPMLATTYPVIGKEQAMLLTAVFFGLLHLDSWPTGVIWAFETGFLGWILAKSMLETRGSLWAWIIHLVVDIPVYLFMAIARFT